MRQPRCRVWVNIYLRVTTVPRDKGNYSCPAGSNYFSLTTTGQPKTPSTEIRERKCRVNEWNGHFSDITNHRVICNLWFANLVYSPPLSTASTIHKELELTSLSPCYRLWRGYKLLCKPLYRFVLPFWMDAMDSRGESAAEQKFEVYKVSCSAEWAALLVFKSSTTRVIQWSGSATHRYHEPHGNNWACAKERGSALSLLSPFSVIGIKRLFSRLDSFPIVGFMGGGDVSQSGCRNSPQTQDSPPPNGQKRDSVNLNPPFSIVTDELDFCATLWLEAYSAVELRTIACVCTAPEATSRRSFRLSIIVPNCLIRTTCKDKWIYWVVVWGMSLWVKERCNHFKVMSHMALNNNNKCTPTIQQVTS